jgi:ATP-binding cassette subfamily B multidrug efflux pump
MAVVQAFASEDKEMTKFEKINEGHKSANIKAIFAYSVFFPVADIVSSITIGMIVWYGGLQNISGISANEYGTIFTFILLSEMLFRPLRQIADKFNTLQMGMVAAARVFKILDTQDQTETGGSIDLAQMEGAIAFENVVFGYLPEEAVLKGISFEVSKGETLAIVGATGAGKSTIINLLNRFYGIQSGRISIDGHNINALSLKGLRSHIAVVLQDVFLFADTIENNISLGNSEVSLSEIEAAAKEIGVHDFIESLPGGYQFNVKERGGMLSSGQRQLIAFLRAYVTKPSILVLDEATSSIDSASEQLIQKATDTITKGRTSIVIAHRLATIQKASNILVMDAGVIVEQGTHEALLKKGGYYKNLYEAQFLSVAVVE